MTLKLMSLKADLKRESEGEWQDYKESAWPEGIRLKVRALTYPAYQADLSDALRVAAARVEKGEKISDEEAAKTSGKLLAKHILLGWENIDPLYSEDAALDALCNPEDRRFSSIVQELASRVSRVDAEFEKDAAKN